MRFGFISDIHLNLLPDKDEFFTLLKEEVRENKLDILIIPGDISERASMTINLVNKMINIFDIPVYYVPGNHDMWYRKNKMTTKNIYEMYKQDSNCLIGKEIHLENDIILMGDIFWYDYTYANHNRFTQVELSQKTYNKRIWQDYFYINWVQDDISKSDELINNMKKRLDKLQDKRIILISHMINHHKYIVPEGIREEWGFFNGFLGSAKLNKLINDYNVEVAACGHVHHRHTFIENKTTYICSCLGYEKEWILFDPENSQLSIQIKKALKVMEI